MAILLQVRKWREQKMEAMMLQQELEARRQKKILEELKAQDLKEKRRRDAEKEKVSNGTISNLEILYVCKNLLGF